MTAAGLTEDGKSKYALHCLRHFFASWCISVQKLLGHSSGRLWPFVFERGRPGRTCGSGIGHTRLSATQTRHGRKFVSLING